MPEIDLKVFPLIASTGTNGFGAAAQLRKRFKRVQQLRDRGAEVDSLFRFAYDWPQKVYRASLALLSLLGFVALVGGLLKLLKTSALPSLQFVFDEYGAAIAIIGILLWAFASIEGFTRLVLMFKAAIGLLKPSTLNSPSWYNMVQFFLDEPQPLFIRELGVESLADLAIGKLVGGAYEDDNFAAKPARLNADERANMALFGCVIEQEHWDRRFPLRSWASFYAALAETRENGVSLFSPALLMRVSAGTYNGQDFYEMIRKAVNPTFASINQPELPQSANVSADVGETLRILVDRYSASAVNLANSDLTGRHFDIARASDAAASFPLLQSESMRPQCLKLLVRWDVWPGIRAGSFIYPFSAGIAALLLDSEALVTLDESGKLSFKSEEQRHVVRHCILRIVQNVERLMQLDSVNGARAYYERLRNEESHPVEWEIAQRVDYILWSEARSKAKNDAFGEWSVGKDGLVSRKKKKD